MIVVNDNYLRVRNADAIMALDAPWWKLHHTEVGKLCPGIKRFTGDARARAYGAEYAATTGGKTLPPNDGKSYVYRGSSSGFAAIGLAVRWGAKHICLVGFDAMREGGAKDGKVHWFGAHPEKLRAPQPLEMWAKEYDALAPEAAARGIRLVQCSLATATKHLTRGSIFEELRAPQEEKAA